MKYKSVGLKPEVRPRLQRAAELVIHRLSRKLGQCRSLTLEEAIDRVVHTAGSSAPGHWYLRWGQTKGEVLRNPEFVPYLRETIEKAPIRGFPRPWYTASLKDELRPLKDGAVKSARVFMPVDLVLLVAQVMVWGDFNDRFVTTVHEGSLGGGHLHGAWDGLCRRLRKHDLFGESDAHQYDTSQDAELREWVYRVRAALCEEHPLTGLLEVLAVNPRVALPDGSLWVLPGGNASGGFSTLTDNTILSMIVLHYVRLSLGVLEGDVEEAEQGDDLLWSTSDARMSPDNFSRVAAADLGLSYDGGSLKDWASVSFCQRRFALDEESGKFVALSDPSRFWDSIRFNREASLYGSALVAQSLLIEHFWHPSIRNVVRDYQDFLGEAGPEITWMSDHEIRWLHLSDTRPEGASDQPGFKKYRQHLTFTYLVGQFPPTFATAQREFILCCSETFNGEEEDWQEAAEEEGGASSGPASGGSRPSSDGRALVTGAVSDDACVHQSVVVAEGEEVARREQCALGCLQVPICGHPRSE